MCLNFNFREEGGFLESENPKWQDLPKFQFSVRGRGVLWEVKTQSAKMCLNFNFQCWGGGVLESESPNGKSKPKVPRCA